VMLVSSHTLDLTFAKKTIQRKRKQQTLCGACPFVGYCGLFSINYFRKKNENNTTKTTNEKNN